MGPDIPYGFKPSDEKSMMVIFHAIVPLDIWEWNDKSEIYLRFGDPQFGNWKFDAGPGQQIRYNLFVFVMCMFVFSMNICDDCFTLYFDRDAGKGLHIFRFDLKMNMTLLRDRLMPYKYTIFADRLAELNDPYELLYEVPNTSENDILNRCLQVPRNKCHSGGTYN